MGPTSDSWSGSTWEIKIEDIITSSHIMKDQVLNTTPQESSFTRASSRLV